MPTTDTPTVEAEPATRAIQFQAPAGLIDRLDALCKTRGLDRTRVMNRAMEAAVNYLDSLPDPLDGMTFGRPAFATGGIIRASDATLNRWGLDDHDDPAEDTRQNPAEDEPVQFPTPARPQHVSDGDDTA